MNMVMYKNRWDRQSNIQLFVSETEFDRSMSQVVKGAKGARTVTFTSTVREVKYDTFKGDQSLRSAALNEGLEILDGCPGTEYDDRKYWRTYEGVF